jgi:hypothetical protein
VETSDKFNLNSQNIGKPLQGNSVMNILMLYYNFPVVKQRNRCMFPLTNKPFHVCIGGIQVFLDGPTGNPRKGSCEFGRQFQ